MENLTIEVSFPLPSGIGGSASYVLCVAPETMLEVDTQGCHTFRRADEVNVGDRIYLLHYSARIVKVLNPNRRTLLRDLSEVARKHGVALEIRYVRLATGKFHAPGDILVSTAYAYRAATEADLKPVPPVEG